MKKEIANSSKPPPELSQEIKQTGAYYDGDTNEAKAFEFTKSQKMQEIASTLSTTEQKLEAFASQKRIGLDITVSFAKDVSILALLSSDSKIEALIQNKVISKTCEMLNDRIYTRVYDENENGKRVHVKADGFFQVFRHISSREGDPQLHYHIIISNRVEYDNKFYSLSAEKVIEDKYYLDAITNYILVAELQKQGLNAYLCQNDARIIDDDRIIERFSKRKEQILQKAKELFNVDRLEALTRDQIKMLVLSTRKNKEETNIETLQDLWIEELKQIGYSIEDFQKQIKKEYTGEQKEEDLEKAFQLALSKMDIEKGIFKTKDLEIEFLRFVSMLSMETNKRVAEYNDVVKFFNEKINDLRLVQLQSHLKNTTINEQYLCTSNYFSIEQEAVQIAERLANTDKLLVSEITAYEYIRKYEEQSGIILSEEQKKAVINVLSSKQIGIINGYAGAGKTAATEVIGMVAREKGYKVYALAPTGKASIELGNALKAKAQTIDSFLLNLDKQLDERTIIFIDEAGMVNTRHLHQLIKIAEEYNCKLVMQGDFRQLKPVQAGDLYTDLFYTFKDNKEVLTELKTIRRQKREDYRALTTAMSERNFREAFKILVQQGYFRDFDTNQIKKEFIQDHKNTLIVSTHNAMKEDLNFQIRDELLKNGVITKQKELTLCIRLNKLEDIQVNDTVIIGNKKYKVLNIDNNLTYTLKDEKNKITELKLSDLMSKKNINIERQVKKNIGIGERIIALKNDSKHNIKNGDMFEVIGVKQNNKIVIRNEHKKLEINLDDYGYFDYGYVVTAHKSQGLTISKVLVCDDGKVNFSLSYVGITRGKDDLKIFTNDAVNFLYRSQFFDEKVTAQNLNLQRGDNSDILPRDEIAKIIIENSVSLEEKELHFQKYSKYIDDLNERQQIQQQINDLKEILGEALGELKQDIETFEKEQKEQEQELAAAKQTQTQQQQHQAQYQYQTQRQRQRQNSFQNER